MWRRPRRSSTPPWPVASARAPSSPRPSRSCTATASPAPRPTPFSTSVSTPGAAAMTASAPEAPSPAGQAGPEERRAGRLPGRLRLPLLAVLTLLVALAARRWAATSSRPTRSSVSSPDSSSPSTAPGPATKRASPSTSACPASCSPCWAAPPSRASSATRWSARTSSGSPPVPPSAGSSPCCSASVPSVRSPTPSASDEDRVSTPGRLLVTTMDPGVPPRLPLHAGRDPAPAGPVALDRRQELKE